MKRQMSSVKWLFPALVFGLAVAVSAVSAARVKAQGGGKSKAEIEKEKALQNPYPNDLGPDEIDDVVKNYPTDMQEGYKLMKDRCAQCHQSARPINSRFVEPDGEDKAAREAAVGKLQKEHPEYFKDLTVWQIESNMWERYVKRMLSKPGCGVEAGGKMTKPEAKKIWKFLAYDSIQRKIGPNAEKWQAHRKKLVEEFKAKYPKRYEELARDKGL